MSASTSGWPGSEIRRPHTLPVSTHGQYFTTNPGRDSQGNCINGGSFTGQWTALGSRGGMAEEEVALKASTCEIRWMRGDPLPSADDNNGTPLPAAPVP